VELSDGASASLSSLSSLSVDVTKSAGVQNVKGLPSETTARDMMGGPDVPATNVRLASIHLDVSSLSISSLRERLCMFAAHQTFENEENAGNCFLGARCSLFFAIAPL
jgi:hypothetical protein